MIDLSPFHRLIKHRCGLLFAGSREEQLTCAVARRCQYLKIDHTEQYLHRLHNDATEFQNLIHLLTINETYFYRESEHLHLLTEVLVPRLLARRQGERPVRIFSAGCSSGEEPYSIRMALQEKFGSAGRSLFTVLGGDIDQLALEKAFQGIYRSYSFRNLPNELQRRYFTPLSCGEWQLSSAIRESVSLFSFNLFSDTWPDSLYDLDVIFFRNVSIYFDTLPRRVIFTRLAERLAFGGSLIVGHTETLANDFGILPQIQAGGVFYFGHAVTPPAEKEELSLPLPRAEEKQLFDPLPIKQSTVLSYATALLLAREKRYQESIACLDALLEQGVDTLRALQLKAHILLNRKSFLEAEQTAHQALSLEPWSIETLLSLGQISRWQQRYGEAMRWFKQAIYAQPECWLAHYSLAELYRLQKQTMLAKREYFIVLQQLAQPKNKIPTYDHLPLGVPLHEVHFLCQHHLAQLQHEKEAS
ncbi:MAG: hypothetical protein H7832_06345 [Magnetococcus sp. DMHC-6]